jgi:hypothetical protein
MLSKICGLGFATWIGISFAQMDNRLKMQHDREDQFWAQRNGLRTDDIRAIRLLVGISDTTRGAGIKNVDATSLKERNHILFVEAGSGRRMRVHVFERTAQSFKEVWSLSEMPRHSWSAAETTNGSGQGICRQAPRDPSARATPDGRIVVEVPILFDPGQRTIPANTYSFGWDGKIYALLDKDAN